MYKQTNTIFKTKRIGLFAYWFTPWFIYIFPGMVKSHSPFLICKTDWLLPRKADGEIKIFHHPHHHVDILMSRQNVRHFVDDMFKMHFLDWKYVFRSWFLMFVPKGLINNMPASVQIMAWWRSGDKPLSEAMKVKFTDVYTSLSVNELTIVHY